MGFSHDPEYADVNKDVYLSGPVTVGTTAVEAKVGATAEPDRETVRIYNASTGTVYFGPPGVTTTTGEPLKKRQWVSLPASSNNPVYIIAASAVGDVIVQEMG